MKSDDRRPHARRRLAGVVLAGVLLALWGAATHGSLPSGSTGPAIESLTPEAAAEGAVVTIRGSNFGPSIGAWGRGGSTLHHRGPHRRERPQGDG